VWTGLNASRGPALIRTQSFGVVNCRTCLALVLLLHSLL